MWVDYQRVMDTPIGKITLHSDGKRIRALEFGAAEERQDALDVLLQAERELTEYFAGRRRAFSVPLCIHGSPWQKAVWQAVAQIPYGQTASYKDIAAQLENPKACRAVGAANNRNPLPIFIPCHRVVGTKGELTGYAGGLSVKQFLLELEEKHGEISGNG